MAKVPFTHLHLHTQYSLLDGAIKHNPLFERVKALGQESVAMTDHGNLFGAVEFHDKARANGVRPILGCEAYIAAGSRFDKERRERESSGHDAISHQLLLAMNETGYRNLIFLISKGFLEGFYYKPRIDMDLLREHSEGLITTSGCLSSLVCRKILGGAQDEAWRLAEEFSRIFDGRYYLELQRHGIPAQDQVNAELLKMSSDLGLPLLATNDAHYLEADDHDHHDALLCIGTASNIQNPNRFRFDGQGFFVKSGEEMLELFHDHPGAVHNSMEIAERCDFELPPRQYHMPEFQVPAGMSREQVLERDSWSGLRQRLGMAPDEPFNASRTAYAERLQHELGVIHRTGFAGYFLIVADFVGFAKQRGIPVGPGRGSSAGSLVAWSLGITGVDPLEYNIIFERFLNPERVSIPDIDVDFCVRGRDEVIRYVSEKYDGQEEGDEHRRVAQIITFGTLQARAAIRDVGRAFGMPYGEVDRIAKLVPETLGITLEQALQQSEELRERSEKDPQVGRLVQTARKLEGLTRHASTHAAGVVIGKEPLIQQVPLYRDPRTGDVLTQFDGSGVDRIGLVKFDFLGLRNLTVLADAEKHIHAAGYPDFSAERIPLDDERTYELLSRGDTEGVFQMESQGMTELVMRFKPRRFEEIIPLIALYRPGPLGSGMVEDFVSRRHGRTRVEYLTPELEEILSETLGVIVYQDQVLQIANRLAGYSLSEADLLRRAMGKKEAKEMAKQRERFVSGCAANGVSKAKARKLFDLITVFAGYGFAKSHSTAYAFLTYQTAYLKANHPREFLAALLSVEAGSQNKLSRHIAHARERKIEVLPPDVNESARDFTPVAEGIRFGLAGVKNVGEGAIESIIEVRGQGGPFSSLFDFTERVDARRVNRRVVESLVKCGAFDRLHANRAALWESLDSALERGALVQRDREVGQDNLFGGDPGESGGAPGIREAEPWSESERLANEREVLGFYVTGHPLEAFAPQLRRCADVTSAETAGREGQEVHAGGMVTKLREKQTKRGQIMAFCTLEDLEGSFEAVFFADAYTANRDLLRRALAGATERDRPALPVVVAGKLENSEPPRILASRVADLERAEERFTPAVELHIALQAGEADRERLLALRGLLRRHKGGSPVLLHLRVPGESETLLALDGCPVRPSGDLQAEIEAMFGRPVAELRPPAPGRPD